MTISASVATSKNHLLCTIVKALWEGTHIFSSVNGKYWHHQLQMVFVELHWTPLRHSTCDVKQTQELRHRILAQYALYHIFQQFQNNLSTNRCTEKDVLTDSSTNLQIARHNIHETCVKSV
jgi:hypothetical protein